MYLLTCREFLLELNEYLDDSCDQELRRHLEAHVSNCPNCFVILDTTKQTIRVYKGMEPQELPESVRSRLMKAVNKRIAASGQQP